MSSNPGLGDEVGIGEAPKVEEGFAKTTSIPSTLLTEKSLISRWRLEPIPKPPNTRIQRYRVWNVTSGEVIWIGRKKDIGSMIRERLAGWQEAMHFPPTVDGE